MLYRFLYYLLIIGVITILLSGIGFVLGYVSLAFKQERYINLRKRILQALIAFLVLSGIVHWLSYIDDHLIDFWPEADENDYGEDYYEAPFY